MSPLVKHGMWLTTEYRAWLSMKGRCLNPKHRYWPAYGGRGISICPQWIDNFEMFFAYVGLRPSCQHSLDRIDNDGNYEPGNVRWATRGEQQRNKRSFVHKKVSCECGICNTCYQREWRRKQRHPEVYA